LKETLTLKKLGAAVGTSEHRSNTPFSSIHGKVPSSQNHSPPIRSKKITEKNSPRDGEKSPKAVLVPGYGSADNSTLNADL